MQRMQQENDVAGYYNNQGEYIAKPKKTIKWCCPKCRSDYLPSDVSSMIRNCLLSTQLTIRFHFRFQKDITVSARKRSIHRISFGMCRIHAEICAARICNAVISVFYSVTRVHAPHALKWWLFLVNVANRNQEPFDAFKRNGNVRIR